MPLIKKCQFFLSLFLVETSQEIRFNNFLDTKEPFFDYERKISEGPKNRIFPRGLTHAFGQKNTNSLFFWFWSKQDKN